MKNFDVTEELTKSYFHEWRRYRLATQDHRLSCVCAECSKRRRAGAKLIMPYSGPVDIYDVRLRNMP